MRAKRFVSLLVVAGCCSGCSSAREVWNWSILRTVGYEASYVKSERRILRHEYELAGQAWGTYQAAHPEAGNVPDFARGYRDGFAGYLHTGTLATPSAPPERYRWFRQDGPTGYKATKDWDAGYRVGATEAAGSGYRDSLVVPTPRTYAGLPQMVAPLPPGEPTPEVIPIPEGGGAQKLKEKGAVPSSLRENRDSPRVARPPLSPKHFFPEDFPTAKALSEPPRSGDAASRRPTTGALGLKRWPDNPLRSTSWTLPGSATLLKAERADFESLVPETDDIRALQRFEPSW